jgi:uncharacterized protein (TIGR03435 family)
MTRAAFATCLLALASFLAPAQPADSGARFGVADIHTSPRSSSPQSQFMRVGFYRGGRYEIRSANMVDLIGTAYGVDPDKVLGGPGWLELHRFDILATAPAGTTPEGLKTMLQALLAERFGLKVHIDKKELPTYALVLGKKHLLRESDGSGSTGCQFELQGMQNGRGGPPADPSAGPPAPPTLAFKCTNMTMAALADYMHNMPLAQQFIGANPLVDETGLKGAWNFEFHYGLPFNLNGQASPGGGNLIVDAIDKQLGLKLEARKLPLPVIVVDGANEKPTDNIAGIAEKLPVAPSEFEVADVKPSDPKAAGPGRGGGFLPGGRLDLKGMTLKDLITIGFDTLPNLVVGGPKFVETDRFDIVAKAPATSLSMNDSATMMGGPRGQPPVDIDALIRMLKALIVDRFKLETHYEERPMDAYTLVAAKPKMKKADPANRTGFHEGPGPDGKDPRQTTPALGRLVTCTNLTMAQLAEALPSIAGGYFQTVSRTVLDSTGLEGAYDFTLSFSGAGMAGGEGGRKGGDARPPSGAPGGVGDASDPNGAMTLADAMEKQIGIKLTTVKRPVQVLVIDKVQQKPTEN